MKIVFKRVLSISMVLVMLISMISSIGFSVSAATYSGTCGDNLTWTLDTSTGVLNITGTGDMFNYTSSSRAPWYLYSSYIKMVNIGDSVTYIGDFAFSDCSEMRSVTIGVSVTSIGNDAFGNCYYLTSVEIKDIASWCGIKFGSLSSNPLTYMGDLVFEGQTVYDLVIPDGVTSIGDVAFGTCSSLRSVKIPGSVTSIGESAFAVCLNLTSVTIGNGVTSIGGNAFGNCSSLTSVTIPDSVTSIGVNPFDNTALYNDDSNWENGILYIGKHLIEANTSISGSYTIKEGTLTIADSAFRSCSGLTNVMIPNSVINIGDSAFADCTNLTITCYKDSYVDTYAQKYLIPVEYITDYVAEGTCGDNLTWTLDDNGTLTISGTGDMYDYDYDTSPFYEYKNEILSIIVKPGVTSIGDFAFCNLYQLTYESDVILPEGLISIGEGAFDSCYAMAWPIMPQSLQYIGYGAFRNCNCMDSVVIPGGVKVVAMDTFNQVYSLKSVEFSEGVERIEDYAFVDCYNLTYVTIADSVTYIDDEAFMCTDHHLPQYMCDCSYCNNFTIICSRGSYADSFAKEKGIPVEYLDTYVAEGICGDNLTWTLDDNGTLTISGTGDMYDYDYDYDTSPFYEYKNEILSIIVKPGVTSIGDCAFYNLYKLENPSDVILPEGLISIGQGAFDSCHSMDWPIMPQSLQYIGYGAFSDCNCMGSAVIPGGVKVVAYEIFDQGYSLYSVEFSEGVERIEDNAFVDCLNLTYVTIADSVTYIDDEAFICTFGDHPLPQYMCDCSYCNNFTIICSRGSYADSFAKEKGIPVEYLDTYVAEGICGDNLIWTLDENGVLVISGTGDMYDYSFDTSPFYKNTDIKTVIIEEGVTSIGKYAFNFCSQMSEIIIPATVTTIGEDAFSWCIQMSEISIPANVTYIGEIFDNCSSLESITVDENNQYYSSDEYGVLFNKGLTKLIRFPRSSKTLTYDIPDTVIEISEKAFYFCTEIQSITLPDSIESIRDQAFCGCYKLLNMRIPENVNCIGYNAFNYCQILSSITVDENNNYYSNDDYGILYNKEKTTLLRCPSGLNITKYEIPDTVITIESHAFEGNDYITNVTIPASVNRIGLYAFDECSKLNNVILPHGIKEISYHTFSNCDSLTNILIPDSVESIDGWAFSYCKSLESITIPKSVTLMSNYTFSGIENKVIIRCYKDSYAEKYAAENSITYNYACSEITTENYTIALDNAYQLSHIRFAGGIYETSADIKNAPDCVDLNTSVITDNTENDIFRYEMADGGIYTLWIKMTDGTTYIKTVDMSVMTQEVVHDGVTMTVKNLYGVKDYFIAKGKHTTYSDVKANSVVQITKNKIGTKHDYTYILSEPGVYTVCVRYDDTTRAHEFITVELTVTEPTFTANGLQLKVGNLDGVKVIRTAYGEYNTPGEIKRAQGARAFTAKTIAKSGDEYTIQYRENGIVTVAVVYNNGYEVIYKYNVTKKVPVMTQEGSTVTFGNLDDLKVIRYAEGTYTTSNQIKNAHGSKSIQGYKIETESYSVTLTPGTYTFCVQYNDESYNYYTVTVN